jgi:hypothetical protein
MTMLTTALLLTLSITAPIHAMHACESAAVERPAMVLALPEWGFIIRAETACDATGGSAATMYALGIDAAEPVDVVEIDADIFEQE